jgi:DNA-binding NarL/FixJ family response regulator
MIRVAVVDDQALVRAGFAVLLNSAPDMEVIGEAGDGSTAVGLVRTLHPDVVLMDVQMPGTTDGLQATRAITSDPAMTSSRVLVLTTFDFDEYIIEALRNGASGFLLKDCQPNELLSAVRVIAQGDALLAPSITQRVIARFTSQPRPPSHPHPELDLLTEREREVLVEVAHGRSNHEIADDLVITYATAKTHVSRLLTKLNAKDRAQLVMIAYDTGVVRPREASAGTPALPLPSQTRRR